MNLKKPLRGRVKVSDAALKKAMAEHGKAPPATGVVKEVGGGLVSVQHDNGEVWDWNPKSVKTLSK